MAITKRQKSITMRLKNRADLSIIIHMELCLSEVIVDCLTGEYKLLAVDILHDVGASLNPAIDMGQIVGGFIQGMGWLCSEELSVG